MNLNTIEEVKNTYPKLVHASNIFAKLELKKDKKLTLKQGIAINAINRKYLEYINQQLNLVGFSTEVIEQRVELLNDYYNFLFENNYDNIFSSQGKLRPTILEEFMYLVVKDMVSDIQRSINDSQQILKLGGVKSYTNLYFKSQDIQSFVNDIQTGINVKDQDFAIYREMNLSVNNIDKGNVNIPIIAVEVKTYLDKTMLEGAIATAEKIKSGNPYSKYYIVTENYDVDLNVDPAYSRIDQIYVLRKSKRKEFPRQEIYADVVSLIVHDMYDYLNRTWGDIGTKLKKQGILI